MAASSAARCCATCARSRRSKWLSLPINQDAAELIEAQQQRLRHAVPGHHAVEAAAAAAPALQPDRAAGDDLRRR